MAAPHTRFEPLLEDVWPVAIGHQTVACKIDAYSYARLLPFDPRDLELQSEKAAVGLAGRTLANRVAAYCADVNELPGCGFPRQAIWSDSSSRSCLFLRKSRKYQKIGRLFSRNWHNSQLFHRMFDIFAWLSVDCCGTNADVDRFGVPKCIYDVKRSSFRRRV